MGPMTDTSRPGRASYYRVPHMPPPPTPDGSGEPTGQWLLFLLAAVCAVACFAAFAFGAGVFMSFMAWAVYPRA